MGNDRSAKERRWCALGVPASSTAAPPWPLRRPALGAGLALAAAAAAAQQAAPVAAEASAGAAGRVVVTATRSAASPFDVPASVDRIEGEALRDARPQANIAEALAGVPGLQARDRQNYAQDVQVSIRGFGARSSFGIRGIRLLVDGIPASMPDGQGWLSHVDLGSVDRIEVLRGPFSALYGNAAGGVIAVYTERGSGPPVLTTGAAFGEHGLRRGDLKLSGSSGNLGYVISGSHFETDGWRAHSAAERSVQNVKLDLALAGGGRLSLVANHSNQPAQDPLGLTRAQFDADPRSVTPEALQYDTRKSAEQTQGGLVYEQPLGTWQLRASAYTGQRATQQFQAIPASAQANPLHPGGVIDLERRYGGLDVRASHRTQWGTVPVEAIGGLAWEQVTEARRGYENFVGSTLGVLGAQRRDEHNAVDTLDPYLQLQLGQLSAAQPWRATLGWRASRVRVRSEDHYITPANGDDSGGTRYRRALPVAGITYAVAPQWRLYATAGRGFETPTLNELAYRPGGAAGLNLALQPATSDNLEAGVKGRVGAAAFTAAVFETRTDHEIVVQTNSAGRATYQNAGRTRRRGLELAGNTALGAGWQARAAYAYVDARYRDAYTTCSGTPCTPFTVPAGNRIPGVARHTASAALDWAAGAAGWRAGVDLQAYGAVPVNDANSDAAGRAAVLGGKLGYALRWGAATVDTFLRVDNLTDRRYAGSVIVNEGNRRYFEPAPGRSAVLGASLRLPL